MPDTRVETTLQKVGQNTQHAQSIILETYGPETFWVITVFLNATIFVFKMSQLVSRSQWRHEGGEAGLVRAARILIVQIQPVEAVLADEEDGLADEGGYSGRAGQQGGVLAAALGVVPAAQCN